MSGITPILDTLLHQVLGKRVDFPTSRPLNEPVQPSHPADALRALHSDSRLDARQPPLAPLPGAAARGLPIDTPTPSSPQGSPPASTSTHFSPAATTIADLLVKFPAPPSVIKPTTRLMPASDQLPSPPLLASRLQASINESGLFYESHLSKWFRGELPRQALEHEPQMWRTQALRTTPAEISFQAGLRPAMVPLPPAPLLPSIAGFISLNERSASPREILPGSMAVNTGPAVQSGAAESQVRSPLAPAMPSAILAGSTPQGGIQSIPGHEASVTPLPADPISETLQGIVRHQLEMLASPVLRWEGDVWSGIFMALMIQLPEGAFSQHSSHHEGEQEEGQEEEPAWHSELTLRIESLGTIGVSLRLKQKRLALTLATDSMSAAMHLERGLADLKRRMERCGLDDVALRVNLAPQEGDVP